MSDMEIANYTYIIFGPSSFHSLPHRGRGIAWELALQGAEVHYIEFPPSRIGRLRDFVDKRFRQKAVERSAASEATPPTLFVHTPPEVPLSVRNSITPFYDKRLFRRWFHRHFAHRINAHTIVWVMMPLWWGWFIDRDIIPDQFIAYDVADDLHVFSTSRYSHWRMERSERSLAKYIDLITYSAGQMAETLRNKFPDPMSQYLPNAIGSPFSQLAEARTVEPHAANRIGFVGIISDKWIDIDLLCRVAQSYPDHELMIVGPIDITNAQKLQQFPNVRLTGFLQHDEVAKLVPSFSVALIPFKHNSITRVVNPLKLYEYSATGIPIVAMETEELVQYSEYIYLSHDNNHFIRNIETALNETSESTCAARKHFALQNTWQQRISTFQHALTTFNL